MIENRLTIKEKHYDYFIVVLFVITTGTVFYVQMLSPAITNVFLLLMGLINKIRINKSPHYPVFKRNNSWWFIVFIIIISVCGHIYYSHSYDDRNLLAYLVNLIASFLIISSYNFEYFRKILTDIVYVITLVGLLIFILNELNYLPTTIVNIPGRETYTMFLCYTLGWPALFHRYSGIWHEPGACQIVLNTILWLHFKNISHWTWEKGELKKIVVIFIGSLLTFSTGSYISLMLILLSIILNLNLKSKHKLKYGFMILLILGGAIVAIFNSDTIQNKLFREDTEENKISTMSRSNDAFALYQMTLERPLLGFGLGTHDFWKNSSQLGNVSNSSGLLVFSASLGITWLLTFVMVAFVRIRNMGFSKEALFLLTAVIVMQLNEDYIEYPLTCIFIFEFGKYAKQRKKLLSKNFSCSCDI